MPAITAPSALVPEQPRFRLATLVACLTAWTAAADEFGGGTAGERLITPRILLAEADAWDGAVPENVVAVLESAGRELLRHVPDAGRPTIVVAARGGPIALFDRTPEGHFQVRLDTGGNHWAQYGFQFGHEICHVLCRAERGPRPHLWFEEALCETASVFVLRRMADAWEHDPPYPNWRDYAPHLRDYADKRLAESPRPESLPLAAWYARHRDELGERPTDRANGLAIAAALLPLFEDDPGRWAVIRWLNAAEEGQPARFRDHLAAWRERVPKEQAAAVEALADAFGEPLPAAVP